MFLYIYNNLFVKQSPYLLIHQIYIRKTRNDARGYRVSIVQFLTQSLEYCIKSSSSYLLVGRSQRMLVHESPQLVLSSQKHRTLSTIHRSSVVLDCIKASSVELTQD